MVYPSRNQYVPSNSMEVLSYNCTVDSEFTVRWEVAGVQHSSPSQVTLGGSGVGLTIVSLDSNDRTSMISISNVTRENLYLQCVAVPSLGAVSPSGKIRRAVDGKIYFVVSYGKSKV